MYCYECEEKVNWLASDGRCKGCTRLTPEEVQGITEDIEDCTSLTPEEVEFIIEDIEDYYNE